MSQNNNHPIIYGVEDHVMYIRINRPDVENCLDWRDSEVLARAYSEASDNEDVRAIVVTGTDGYFHTGGRVDSNNPEEKHKFSEALRTRNQIIANFKVPLIVAVNGVCLGGGMSLLLHADIAFAGESAVFGYPEILRGSFPVMSMVATMPVIPKKQALELFYFGQSFSPQQAQQMGLVNRVVPDDRLDAEVRAFASAIAEQPKELISIGRGAYYHMMELALPEREEYGGQVLAQILEAQAKYEKEAAHSL